MTTTILARVALTNTALWEEIHNGKKILTWRIGHQVHRVTYMYQAVLSLMVELDDAEDYRRIKPTAKLKVVYKNHPFYRERADILLNILQQTNPAIEMTFDEHDQQYEFRRITGKVGDVDLRIGANVTLESLATRELDFLKDGIERLLQV